MPERRRFKIALSTLSIAFGSCLYAQSSLAEPKQSSAVLRYEAPAECPTQQAFLDAILVRTRQLPSMATDDTDAFVVRIVGTATGFIGSLHVAIDGNQALDRTLDDAQCNALVEAMALLVAMELSPSPAPTPKRAVARPDIPAGDRHHQMTAVASTEVAEPRGGYRTSIAGVVGLQRAPAPGALLSVGAALSLRHRTRFASAGVSLQYGQTGRFASEGGEVRFRWFDARFFECPLGRRFVGVGVAACATTEVGLLRGEPEHTNRGTSRNALWVAPGLGVLLSVERRGFVLDGFAGALVPLLRHKFYFASAEPSGDQIVANRPPIVGFASELRVGVVFE